MGRRGGLGPTGFRVVRLLVFGVTGIFLMNFEAMEVTLHKEAAGVTF